MVTSRLDTWEPGSALEAIALWHRARMEGNKIKLSQTCWNLVKLDQTCSFAHLATRFLLEVRDRHSEFSGPSHLLQRHYHHHHYNYHHNHFHCNHPFLNQGPWQLLHPLPDASQLQLVLNFSIAARFNFLDTCFLHDDVGIVFLQQEKVE